MNASVYWSEVQAKVCRGCKDFSLEQTCLYDGGKKCALSRAFPRVLQAVYSASRASSMNDYVDSVRRHVCGNCPNQDSRGRCVVRNNQDCVLYSNLETVVQIIKETRVAA